MYDTPFHSDSLEQKTFLITGGAGFIGSNLVDYLMKFNAKKVRVLDNLSEGDIDNLKEHLGKSNFEFIDGDICNFEVCQKACEGIDYVSHQAALGSVPRSIKSPIATNEANVTGFVNILTAAKDAGVKRVVYASSSSVYGDSKELPKKEENTGNAISPYAVTKAVNELYANVFAHVYGMELIGLRYFNIFGPKQNPKGAYAAVIPLFVDALMDNEAPFINGDGEQTRDFTFVENAVQANVKALLASNPDAVNKVYNVALGERITINQLYRYIKELMNSNVEVIHRAQREGDIRDSLADTSLAENLLGYKPGVKVKEGLGIALDWYISQRNKQKIS